MGEWVRRYPIYRDYDENTDPIGFVDIVEGALEDSIFEGAIIPKLVKKTTETPFEVASFGLVPRTEVDTRPREL